ncbi:vesicle transport protein USE1 [Diorhabda sublineata]|uniref:vesicle transport protein USE1 n=1 Tax=Diorhabda sublineata TaxID=1163346 RepID=UPI0024E14E3D|nr:vesicle transport protein USE1 [Diorhabda sublineata]
MGLSRQEVNLRRLLAKCELMCKTKKEDDRIEKYVETLEDMLQELKKITESSESIQAYNRRINYIKTALGITKNKYEDENDPESMRKDLLGLRQRIVDKPEISNSGDFDKVIEHNENIQRKITEDMLHLTMTLKEQSEISNRIIKKDTEVVSKSTEITENNFGKLSVESSKLAEHSKRAWKCWMWIMLVAVVIVFINMVLFMKLMKKRY